MACNTFLTIAQKCREEFVMKHNNKDEKQLIESEPYIYELIRKTPEETHLLEVQQKYIFYESIGHIISAEVDLGNQEVMLNNTLQQMLKDWVDLIQQAQ